MLRIVPTTHAGNAKGYFNDGLTHEDYYTGNETATGRWFGKGAERLGLSGDVRRRDFADLCDNRRPGTDQPLTPRSKAVRRVAYDYNFNCPKSVTLLHELGGDGRVLDAVLGSARTTMADIEADVQTRVRTGGASGDRITGNLVGAEFVHRTARPTARVADPHLHLHCFIFNATFDAAEDRWKAAQFGGIKSRAPYYESLFLSRLAERLHELGYTTTPKGRYFEVDGIPREAVERFSRRTEHIEHVAAKRGVESAERKAGIGARTRQNKAAGESPGDLREEWNKLLTPEERAQLAETVQRARDRSSRECSGDPAHTRGEQEPALGRPEVRNGRLNSEERPAASRDRGPNRDGPTAGRRDTSDEHGRGSKRDGFENGHRQAGPGDDGPDICCRSASDAADLAMGRLFERKAVVPEWRLMDEGLRVAPGRVTAEQLRAEFDRRGLIRRQHGGVTMVTTKDVLKQEQELVRQVSAGHGGQRPLAGQEVPTGKYNLRPEQLRALNHVLRSRDLVTLVEGPAGTGKTSVLRAFAGELADGRGPLGRLLPDRVIALAPTADASRRVLRDHGFENATTVSKFLVDSDRMCVARKVGESALGRVVWVDEASLMGIRQMSDLVSHCRQVGARLVLSHDPRQHESVARGSCVRVLREHAGLGATRVEEIQRQRGEYRRAVESLGQGRVEEGVNRLAGMGAIKEWKDHGTAVRQAAADYVESLRAGKRALLIAPTHAVGKDLTKEVRGTLKEEGVLRKPRNYTRLVPVEGTVADRSRAAFYNRGQVVQFHQNAAGFRAGSRWKVWGRDPFGNVVVQCQRELKALPLKKADRFEVFTKQKMEVAVGDLVRITKNGRTFSGAEAFVNSALGLGRKPKRDLNNGSVCRVKRFTPSGNVLLDNGLLVPKDYGHLTHGYVSTSFGSQGKTVDKVIVCQTRAAGRAAHAEQFYVSVSRGKESVTVHTEDLAKMREAVCRSSVGISAMDLVHGRREDRDVLRGIELARVQERERDQGTSRERQRNTRGFDRDRT